MSNHSVIRRISARSAALPWIIGIRSTVSSKYSTIGCEPISVTPWSGSTITGVSPGRVQVDELVALLPRVLAHQLMADALLGEDQADLARKGAERELEELPHGAAALAASGAVRLALRDRSDRAYSRARARSPCCASSSALHHRRQRARSSPSCCCWISASPRRSAAGGCGRNSGRRGARGRATVIVASRRASARGLRARPATSPTGMSRNALRQRLHRIGQPVGGRRVGELAAASLRRRSAARSAGLRAQQRAEGRSGSYA